MADLPPTESSSGQEWQYQISTVRAHILQITWSRMAILRFLLLELILADQLADLPPPPVEASSGQEWQYQISTVRVHIGRSTGKYISPFLLLQLILAHQMADLPPTVRVIIVVKNSNMTFLLLELILADHLVKNGNIRFLLLELPYWQIKWQLYPLPQVDEPSGKEWQNEISTVRVHIRRSTGRYI